MGGDITYFRFDEVEIKRKRAGAVLFVVDIRRGLMIHNGHRYECQLKHGKWDCQKTEIILGRS